MEKALKCESCGSDLSIENAYCPHCGCKNEFYAAHRADMDEYEKKFEETREEVTKQVVGFRRKAIFITTVSVLCVIIFAEIFALLNLDRINYKLEKRLSKKNAASLAAELEKYESAKDVAGFDYCYEGITSVTTAPVSEYVVVGGVVLGYSSCLDAIAIISAKNFQYCTSYDIARRINSGLNVIYQFENDAANRPNDLRYLDKHIEFVEYMKQESFVYISSYCNIPYETVKGFDEMSDTQRFSILNDSIEKVYEDEKGFGGKNGRRLNGKRWEAVLLQSKTVTWPLP